jgi:hypothetical protein
MVPVPSQDEGVVAKMKAKWKKKRKKESYFHTKNKMSIHTLEEGKIQTLRGKQFFWFLVFFFLVFLILFHPRFISYDAIVWARKSC